MEGGVRKVIIPSPSVGHVEEGRTDGRTNEADVSGGGGGGGGSAAGCIDSSWTVEQEANGRDTYGGKDTCGQIDRRTRG